MVKVVGSIRLEHVYNAVAQPGFIQGGPGNFFIYYKFFFCFLGNLKNIKYK